MDTIKDDDPRLLAVMPFFKAAERGGGSLTDLARAAIGAADAAGWMPIATAPRDGTRVLCYVPGNLKSGTVNLRHPRYRVDWTNPPGVWWLMYPEAPYTHWRPLPTPPAAKETEA